ncbi:MAG: zf-HC2 domain-containing protein [Acidobacteria bacterium]|nr:zf-HC2 domain-containing protein [Acidobacteriota bacterium]
MIFRSKNPHTCRQVGRVIQSYLDDELDEQRRAAVESHLENCRNCGLDAETFNRLRASLLRVQPMDDAVLNRLRDFGESLKQDAAG